MKCLFLLEINVARIIKKDEYINVLLMGSGDCRHILKTLSRRFNSTNKKFHVQKITACITLDWYQSCYAIFLVLYFGKSSGTLCENDFVSDVGLRKQTTNGASRYFLKPCTLNLHCSQIIIFYFFRENGIFSGFVIQQFSARTGNAIRWTDEQHFHQVNF